MSPCQFLVQFCQFRDALALVHVADGKAVSAARYFREMPAFDITPVGARRRLFSASLRCSIPLVQEMRNGGAMTGAGFRQLTRFAFIPTGKHSRKNRYNVSESLFSIPSAHSLNVIFPPYHVVLPYKTFNLFPRQACGYKSRVDIFAFPCYTPYAKRRRTLPRLRTIWKP